MYAGLVWFGTIGLTGYSTMLIVLSKLAVAILLSVGPIFILLLIFVNTKSLFEGWLRTLLNYAIVPIFVYALLALILMIFVLLSLFNASKKICLVSVLAIWNA